MNGMGDILPDLNALLRRLGVMVVAEDLGGLVTRIDAVSEDELGGQIAADRERFEWRSTCRLSATRTRRGWSSRSAVC